MVPLRQGAQLKRPPLLHCPKQPNGHVVEGVPRTRVLHNGLSVRLPVREQGDEAVRQRKALKILDGLNSRHVHLSDLQALKELDELVRAEVGACGLKVVDDTLRVGSGPELRVHESENDIGSGRSKELIRLLHVVLEHHGLRLVLELQAQGHLVERRLIFGAMLELDTGRFLLDCGTAQHPSPS